MMGSRNRFVTCAVLSGVLAIGLGGVVEWAFAVPPPPPRFSELELYNDMPSTTVNNITVKLFCSQPDDDHSQIETAESMRFFVRELKPGQRLILATGSDANPQAGLHGVARIEVSAQCPAGINIQGGSIQIETVPIEREPAFPGMEHSGFCREAPAGQQDYMPTARFHSPNPGVFSVTLQGRGRWRSGYDQAVVVTKNFR